MKHDALMENVKSAPDSPATKCPFPHFEPVTNENKATLAVISKSNDDLCSKCYTENGNKCPCGFSTKTA